MKKLVFVFLLLTSPALADEAVSEAVKRAALLKAYHMNNDQMKGWGSYDLSSVVDDEGNPIVCGLVKPENTATGRAFFECAPVPALPPVSVKTTPVAPSEPKPAPKPKRVAQAEPEEHRGADICRRHRMHKVWSGDGKRWNCRR